jgi:hypothetical protein
MVSTLYNLSFPVAVAHLRTEIVSLAQERSLRGKLEPRGKLCRR